MDQGKAPQYCRTQSMWFPQPFPSDPPAASKDSTNRPPSSGINPTNLQQIPAGILPPASTVPIQTGPQQYVHGGYIVDPSAAAMIQMMMFRQQQYAAAAAAAAASPNGVKALPMGVQFPVNPYYNPTATPIMMSPYFAAPTFVQQPATLPTRTNAPEIKVEQPGSPSQNPVKVTEHHPTLTTSPKTMGRMRGRPRKRARLDDEDEYVDPSVPVRPHPRYSGENSSTRSHSTVGSSSVDGATNGDGNEGDNGNSEQPGFARYGLRTSARKRSKVVDDASNDGEDSGELNSEEEQSAGSNEDKNDSGSDGGSSRADKRLKCPYCDRTFNQSCSLKDHLNIHNNVRPYTCSDCGRSFSNSSNLNRHRRIHTGARPYHCDICMKTFSQSSNLKVHRRIHENKAAIVAMAGVHQADAPVGPTVPTSSYKPQASGETNPLAVFNNPTIVDFEFIGDTAARPQLPKPPTTATPPAAAVTNTLATVDK